MATRTAIVSGAASGVGAALVERLDGEGWSVVGVDLRRNWLECAWVEGDVADAGTWAAAVAAAEELGAPPTGLVANAAVQAVGTVEDVDEDEWRRVFDVNVHGAYHGIRAVLPGMRARGGGSIVTVASVDAFQAEQAFAAYVASKGALLQLTRAVALDCARDGIRANCLCPGVTDTPFFRRHLHSADDPDAWLAERVARQPIGRLLEPDDVAAVAAFLLSDDARAMTGAMTVADGGLSTGFDFR